MNCSLRLYINLKYLSYVAIKLDDCSFDRRVVLDLHYNMLEMKLNIEILYVFDHFHLFVYNLQIFLLFCM